MFAYFYQFVFDCFFHFLEQPVSSVIIYTVIIFSVCYILHLLDRG